MMKGYDDHKKSEKLLLYLPRNYVEQTFTSLQINKIFHKNNLLQYKRQCTRLVSSTLQ